MSRAGDEDTQQTTLDGFEATDVAVELSRRSDTISDVGDTLDPDAVLAPDDDMVFPEGTLTGDQGVRRSTAAEIDAAFCAILDEDVVELRDSAIVDTLDVDATLDARDSVTLDVRDPDTDARMGFLDTATLEVPARGSQVRMDTSTEVAAAPPPPRLPLPRRLPTEAGWSPPSRGPRAPRIASPGRRAAVFAAVPDEEPVSQVDDDLA